MRWWSRIVGDTPRQPGDSEGVDVLCLLGEEGRGERERERREREREREREERERRDQTHLWQLPKFKLLRRIPVRFAVRTIPLVIPSQLFFTREPINT